jgi:hypothetical protein
MSVASDWRRRRRCPGSDLPSDDLGVAPQRGIGAHGCERVRAHGSHATLAVGKLRQRPMRAAEGVAHQRRIDRRGREGGCEGVE